MLIVRDLGIEIGARRILNPVSFTVGNSEKVGIVGRNGAGKSTLMSILLGEHPEHLRIEGSVTHQGTMSHLPQEPVPGGLGVEPIGLSHMLSARGLDELDADMQHARHDLPLLDKSINRVLALREGQLREYKGNYTKFLHLEEERRLSEEKLASHQDEEIGRLSKLADSMRGQTETRARLAKVLDRKVEKLQDNRVEVTKKERKVTFKLPLPPRSGDVPMTVEHVAVTYGSLQVLKDVNFITRRGDRIVIVGRNGAGKSSMLRCLAGTQKAQKGLVKFGANVTVGYFAQENEQLDFEKTVLGNLENATVVTEVQRRSLLGAFGLKGSAAHQMPATLSGGERAKLALAILASSDANLLLLDEPTNNLDPGSVLALGEMMLKWKGTLVAVSHERGFVETLEPTHAVLLPEEYFDLWNDDYMDVIEQR